MNTPARPARPPLAPEVLDHLMATMPLRDVLAIVVAAEDLTRRDVPADAPPCADAPTAPPEDDTPTIPAPPRAA